jgi:hypothetical protein
MLVLPIKGIYEVRRWDGLRWHDIRIKFHEDCNRRSSNNKALKSKSKAIPVTGHEGP